MQSTFDPDIVIDKIDIQMDGTSIQVLISYRKDQKVIAINPVSDTRIIVQAPYGLSKEELQWHIRSYLTAQDRNETTVTKKNTGPLTGGTIHIRGLDIPYTVIQNPRRKTLYLSVYPDGRVEVENPGVLEPEGAAGDWTRAGGTKRLGCVKGLVGFIKIWS